MSDPSPLIAEIGPLARWTTSSHKYGFGVENLRDGDDSTFWQSEGPQPHLIDLTFPKKVMVSSIHICLAHSQDDSYTPSKISLQAGTGVHDLQEVRMLDLDKPDGWLPYPLRPITVEDPSPTQSPVPEGGEAKTKIIEGPPIPAHHIRIQIITNHLNGKDTHVRGVKVYGLAGTTSTSAPPTYSGSSSNATPMTTRPPLPRNPSSTPSHPVPQLPSQRATYASNPPRIVFQASHNAVPLSAATRRRKSAGSSGGSGEDTTAANGADHSARPGAAVGEADAAEDEEGNAIIPMEWEKSLAWVNWGEEIDSMGLGSGFGTVEFTQHQGIR